MVKGLREWVNFDAGVNTCVVGRYGEHPSYLSFFPQTFIWFNFGWGLSKRVQDSAVSAAGCEKLQRGQFKEALVGIDCGGPEDLHL